MNEWAESRLKSILKEPLLYGLNESAEEDRTDWPRYIRITDFDDFNNLSDDTFRSLSPLKAKYAWLKNGDILFARSGATAGKTYLYSSLPNGACYAGYLIRARLSQKKVFPDFLSYFTKSFVYENWKNRVNIQTTIQNISAEKYYQMPFRYPDLDTQRRIVTYLDSHVSSIDKRVSLLTTKRDHYLRLKTAIINRAVTQGLNPDVKMKDSGVEWIGMIPEHWEIKRIKEIGKLRLGKMLTERPKDGYVLKPYLKSKNVSWLNLNLDSVEEMYFSVQELKELRLHSGDLVITEGGEVGKTAIWREELKECYIQNSVHKLTFKSFCDSRYYCYFSFFLGQKDFYKSIVNLVSIMHLTYEKLRRLSVPVPPLSEQQAIATYLDEKCAKIDAIVENLNQQIEKHKLLKRALVNEVITGQRAV